MEHPQHEHIDQYLDGSLSAEDRAAFEARLNSDPDLAQALRLHEAARAAIEMQAFIDRRDNLRQRGLQKLRWRKWQWQVQDFLENIFVKKQQDGSGRLRIGLITGISLATIALIVLLVNPELFFDSTDHTPKPLAVPKEQAIIAFNTYYNRMALPTTLGGADPDSLYRVTREQYRQVDCTNVLYNLDILLQDPAFSDTTTAFMMQGTCLIDQGKPEAALERLKRVPPAATVYYKEAQWYIALAYLQQERVEEASELLRKIAADPRQPRQAEAKAILELGK